jgi:hypothetical protein
MFHDFGASPLNFTMAKATGFQSVFSPACKPAPKKSPSNSSPATEIKRWSLISLVDARFPFGGEISRNPDTQSSLGLGILSVWNEAAKVDHGIKTPREGLIQFRDIGVTAFLLALSEFARHPHSTYRIKPPQWDEIAGEAQRESKNETSFVQEPRFARSWWSVQGETNTAIKSIALVPNGHDHLGHQVLRKSNPDES